MKSKYMRFSTLLVSLFMVVLLTCLSAQATESSANAENPRYLTTDEVLELTQYHIDGYMATDWQTAGRDITASDQFIDLYDTNDELFAYMVPLMEDGENIGYITMPAKNSGATFYEIYIRDGIVNEVESCANDAASSKRNAADTKLYFIPPYSYVLAIEEAGNTSFYELQTGNVVEMVDISSSFSLQADQTTYAAQEQAEVVNDQIMSILQPVCAHATSVTVQDVRLSHEADFIRIPDTELRYGGDQAWYTGSSKQSNGCGPVAAANITYYLDEQSTLGISGLYNYSSLTKSNFLSHMNTLYSYCAPSVLGDFRLGEWTDDVVAYASSRGVTLTPFYTSLSVSYENCCTYIKGGLRKDSPVATLNLNPLWDPYGWHWMTITKYYRGTADDRYVAVSTWGARKSLNYDPLYNSMLCGGGLMYFT